jgi:hypothetical protein
MQTTFLKFTSKTAVFSAFIDVACSGVNYDIPAQFAQGEFQHRLPSAKRPFAGRSGTEPPPDRQSI